MSVGNPWKRLLPFSGIGVGLGLGVGCGAGVATGTGDQAFPIGKLIPGFGFGGGCGIGFGFGWGMFAFAVGTPVRRTEQLLGRTQRLLDNAAEQLRQERASGKRPPFSGGLPQEMRTNDPLLDRILRGILARRAQMKQRPPILPPP